MKTISVIIPTYNHARFLRDAVDSALAQTYAPLEVIVVDDGSTDATPRILAAYGDRIRAIRRENGGVGAARNTGIAAARGELLAFLDSDDIWRPAKLEMQVARFEADPGLGLVHCRAETFDDAGKLVHAPLVGLEGWVAMELLRFDRGVIAAPCSATVVPKRVAEELGGFDPRLQPSEDWDFYYRLATRYRIGYVNDILVHYRIHSGGIHLNTPGMERGMLLALEKAFASPDPAVQSLRNHTYGRVHRVLAGCYFQSRKPRQFVRHMIKSLRYDPRNAVYFASYPLRVIARLRAGAPPAATPGA